MLPYSGTCDRLWKERQHGYKKSRTGRSQDTTKTDDENKSDTKNDTEQTDDKKEESEKTKSVMKIYSINMSSGEIQTEDVETDSLNEEKIWSLLQEKSVITPECGMNLSK